MTQMPFTMLEIPFDEIHGTSALIQEKTNKSTSISENVCECPKKIVPLQAQTIAREVEEISYPISQTMSCNRAHILNNSLFYHMKENLLKKAIEDGIIAFNDDRTRIKYLAINKERRFTDPEEPVQADAYLSLIYVYKYPVKRIRMFVPVTMGSDTKEADIVVYSDDNCTMPYIMIECKKEDVSEAEFIQAIEQAYSYAYALPGEIKFAWVTSGIRNEYFEVDKQASTHEKMPDIPQFGVSNVANYKYVYDAESLPQEDGKQKFFPLAVIEQAELTKRFKQAHDALWGGGELNPSEAFDELDKLIFCKIWDERKDRKAGDPYDFQIITVSKEEEPDAVKRHHKESEQLKERINQLYEEGRTRDKEVFRDNIKLNAEKIRTVVGYFEGINLSETDLDSKGRAFETFMTGYFRGNFGQYFTPREIVKFIVNVLPIKNDSKVLDTSCGSGGFLLYALDKVRKAATEIYPNYKEKSDKYARWFSYWHDFARQNLYGIEINEQISRAAKMNMIIHDDGHTNVITSDGLISDETILKNTGNNGFKYGTFDFIITNPPFGNAIKQTEHAYLRNYNLGKKQEDWLALKSSPTTIRDNQLTEVLFLEQDYKFLKPGGFLAVVIPDGVLTNSSLQYVRDEVADWFRIVGIVSMPSTAFSANGAGVKSSVMFLRKWDVTRTEKLKDQKLQLQQSIREQFKYKEQCVQWDIEKKHKLKDKENAIRVELGCNSTEAKKSPEFKDFSKALNEEYSEKLLQLKDAMNEQYLHDLRQASEDYPIFMAIANEIGYDATGKPTATNELEFIGSELKKFIQSL